MTTTTKTTDPQTTTITLANGIKDIINNYDVFLLDMWGVMHDGFTAYDGVIDCVHKLKQANKKCIILSNSSQRKKKSIQNLQKLGFNPETDFEQIITSGEVAFQMLKSCQGWSVLSRIQQDNKHQNQDNKLFVLGTSSERDIPYVNDSGWKLAPIDQADLILASGSFSVHDGQTETNKRTDPQAYEQALQQSLQAAAKRGLPMIVSNPDKIRPDFERPPMPGAIGDLYEQALLDNGIENPETFIKRIGKPFQDVYEIALKDTSSSSSSSSIDKSRVCMVGDALETDVTGGAAAGIDTVWILEDGVYIPELQEAQKNGKTILEAANEILQEFNGNKEENTYAKGKPDLLPTVALSHFRW